MAYNHNIPFDQTTTVVRRKLTLERGQLGFQSRPLLVNQLMSPP
ncbi:MAG TPA: hypothetical protein VMV29_18790 [Ktedonobacterales bacterium]|nr:hypothetical protein [Ktedonobacterales bacterium]